MLSGNLINKRTLLQGAAAGAGALALAQSSLAQLAAATTTFEVYSPFTANSMGARDALTPEPTVAMNAFTGA